MAAGEQRLLFSLAHPDDESFGFAGTIIHCARQGVDVHLICATNGDVGTIDDEFMEGFGSVAERRLHELKCAAEVLGLTVHTFGYRDSGMAGTADNEHPDSFVSKGSEEIIRRVTEVIRRVRPQVIVTFDPTGGYGHPDHIAIHEATVAAFEAAGDENQFPEQIAEGLRSYTPQKLYYNTADLRMMRWVVKLAPFIGVDPTRMGRNNDMNARQIAERESGPLHLTIKTGPYRDVMERAWDCHASQQFSSKGIVQWVMRRTLRGNDHYTRMFPRADDMLRENDLFEGVALEEADYQGR